MFIHVMLVNKIPLWHELKFLIGRKYWYSRYSGNRYVLPIFVLPPKDQTPLDLWKGRDKPNWEERDIPNCQDIPHTEVQEKEKTAQPCLGAYIYNNVICRKTSQQHFQLTVAVVTKMHHFKLLYFIQSLGWVHLILIVLFDMNCPLWSKGSKFQSWLNCYWIGLIFNCFNWNQINQF